MGLFLKPLDFVADGIYLMESNASDAENTPMLDINGGVHPIKEKTMKSLWKHIVDFFSSKRPEPKEKKMSLEEKKRIKKIRFLLESAYLNGKTAVLHTTDGITITIDPSAIPEILDWVYAIKYGKKGS
jgi:hypothetical protein